MAAAIAKFLMLTMIAALGVTMLASIVMSFVTAGLLGGIAMVAVCAVLIALAAGF